VDEFLDGTKPLIKPQCSVWKAADVR